MDRTHRGYSPTIFIYLQVGDKKLPLSDLGYRSARVAEPIELPASTEATLIISIDGVEQREGVLLDHRVSKDSTEIVFSYSDPTRLNGRHLSF